MSRCQQKTREATLANRLVALHEINERTVDYLLFDGLICFNNIRRRVKKVPFNILSIGRYQTLDSATVGPDLWIQSFKGAKDDVWYQLKKPSLEYQPYQQTFQWIADLAKHVIDYMHLHTTVNLSHFRESFYVWLKTVHGFDSDLAQWLKWYNRTDFRGAIVAHANFLYCEAARVDRTLSRQPIWAEIDTRDLSSIPKQTEGLVATEMTVRVDTGKQWTMQRKTTVTPYVHSCFANLSWAAFLHSSLSTTLAASVASVASVNEIQDTVRPPVKIGDVVAINSHGESLWTTDDTEYYAYVQNITTTLLGRSLSLLWFYRPVDTACQKMCYPFNNELFLSDHCNCGDAEIYEHDVVCVPKVTFFGTPYSPGRGLFCRQQYVQGDNEWRTLQKDQFQFQCRCRSHMPRMELKSGDTLLVKRRSKIGRNILEPVILIDPTLKGSDECMIIRRLLRKGRDYGLPHTAPNELVYTEETEAIRASTIERRCQIRFFTEHQMYASHIPHPYNKNGQGDFFFITTRGCLNDLQSPVRQRILRPLLQPWPTPMKEGWLPEQDRASLRPLRGLDIFCGGGNFGRGLEEGGAVETNWAVDYFNEAVHTYKANARNIEGVKLFRGSVNDYLSKAKAGKGTGFIAQKGQVDFISAGSPCQGSSLLNPQRGVHDRGLLNESLIAAAVSFIDFYRPKYALLENVSGLASGGDKRNVLAQVISALVGMGFQVRTFLIDAWNFGSPQSRSRIFISCAAAGLKPLQEPAHTHSHPEWVRNSSLGRTANGLTISSRHKAPTPFEYITAGEAFRDLPETDGQLSCIPFPDHRSSVQLSTIDQIRVESIPRHPAGMSFVKAVERGCMPQAQIDSYSWKNPIRGQKASRTWQRTRENGLIPTVTTAPRPSDGVAGECLHWSQHRLLTIMEARRAQGVLDHEPIIGEKSQQYKIIGNSVARPVAFALGLSLRAAWHSSLEQVETDLSEGGIIIADTMTPYISDDQPVDAITKLGRIALETHEVNQAQSPSTVKVVVPIRQSIVMPPETSGSVTEDVFDAEDDNQNSPIKRGLALLPSQPGTPLYSQLRSKNAATSRTSIADSPDFQEPIANPSSTTGNSCARSRDCSNHRAPQ